MAHPCPHLPHLPLLLLLCLPLLPLSLSEGEISVGAPVVAVEEGHRVEIPCTSSETQPPLWFTGTNATGRAPISEDSSRRVFSSNGTGTLTVQAAMLNDSGTYLCQAFSRQHSVTVDLRVYVMPTYLTEGVILLAISAVLLALFLVGVGVQLRQRRKKMKKMRANRPEGLAAAASDLNVGCNILELL